MYVTRALRNSSILVFVNNANRFDFADFRSCILSLFGFATAVYFYYKCHLKHRTLNVPVCGLFDTCMNI